MTQEERDAEWRRDWNKAGRSPEAMAKLRACSERRVYEQRNTVQNRNPEWKDLATGVASVPSWPVPQMVNVTAPGSVHILGSDLHTWRDPAPLMWKVFCAVAHELKPDCIWMVGDAIDGARVSRHGRTPGVVTPKPQEEIDTALKWYGWLPDKAANGEPVQKRKTMGNHDIRIDNYLANQAPELEDYAGRLSDRFSDWEWAWAYTINGKLEVRHRYHGGIHAAYNNVVKTGISIATGHTHQSSIRPYQDRRGIRWGIELGMLGDPDHPAFMYGEGAPSQHRPGFAVVTFDAEGTMLPPELCEWHDGRAWFRGKVYADVRGVRVRVKAGRAA
jgi:hypothetical protein